MLITHLGLKMVWELFKRFSLKAHGGGGGCVCMCEGVVVVDQVK